MSAKVCLRIELAISVRCASVCAENSDAAPQSQAS